MRKVILILCDGMRSDSVEACGHSMPKWAMDNGKSTLHATTVMPSITLPCIMSLCHSVRPEKHGVFTLKYAQPLQSVEGLFERLAVSGKRSSFYYDWEELCDLYRPGSVGTGTVPMTSFLSGGLFGYHECDKINTQRMLEDLKTFHPDFVFHYLGDPDHKGHTKGWMSEQYLNAVYCSWDLIQTIYESVGDEYVLLVTADHGGHAFTHGEEIPEDMEIPFFCFGKGISHGKIEHASILDVAPTVAHLMQVEPSPFWEGRPLV